jgi:hypothetical protein
MKLPLLLPVVALLLSLASIHAAEKKKISAEPEPRIHPKVFNYIEGWLSDGESPVVTEINLDAVQVSRNQFQNDEVKDEDGWVRSPNTDGNGFLRYRVTEHKGNRYKVDYQNNGGGTLTTASMIEFSIEKRDVRVDGKTKTIRVLRVLSYASKP